MEIMIEILTLCQTVIPLSPPHLTFSYSTGYKLLTSSFPLEDKDLITFPLFCHPYHSTGRKSVLPGGLIDTYLIKGKAFFLSLYSAFKCVALISDLKNSFVCLKFILFQTVLIGQIKCATNFAFTVHQYIHFC